MTQIGRDRASHLLVAATTRPTSVRLAWSARTEVGNVRKANEDSYVARAPLFAVADGMGGHAAGGFASSRVVTRLAALETGPTVGTEAIDRALFAAVADIVNGAPGSDRSTGTTVTGMGLAVVAGEVSWAVFNIGDSRVYRLHDGELTRVTTDHSIVQELVDAGSLAPEDAESHPHSNIITRAIGFNEPPVPDYRFVPVVEGDRLLLCSDGLTKELTDYGIQGILASSKPARETADDLTEAALGNGGRDNVTVVVVDVLGRSDEDQDRSDGGAADAHPGQDVPVGG